jgi:hypothetical protein
MRSQRIIVNVATGHYAVGQKRLMMQLSGDIHAKTWPAIPGVCPSHEQKPYAFKAYAMREASEHYDTLLWCDACIVLGARPLTELFELIEDQGYWFASNGFSNYEWTADSAYPDLFPGIELENARDVNKTIPHVVATAFGLSMKHPLGRVFLAEYFRLASKTHAFCGPWINAVERDARLAVEGKERALITPGSVAWQRCHNCGPADVRGHRHDQTAASVIASRLHFKLTQCPEWFSYAGGETEKTCLIADGAY